MECERSDVDGIPAFWVPSASDQLTAGLVFRVGRADETLATSGITYLIEHLALHPLAVDTERHFNGQVDALTTTFVARGAAEDITGFLGSVCASLRDLPMGRLSREKDVLRAEAATRKVGTAGLLLRHRYGAAGHGLLSYPELGIAAAGPGELAGWARRWFTAGNAALWVSGGPPPAGLKLDLPEGERMPAPAAQTFVSPTPAAVKAKTSGPASLGLVRRSVPAPVYVHLLREMLAAELRHSQGLTYAPVADYSVRDGSYAHVMAGADGVPDTLSILVSEFTRLLARLAYKPVDADRLGSVKDKMLTAADVPSAVAARVRRAASNELFGLPTGTLARWKEQVSAVSEADVLAVAEEAFRSALFVFPHGHKTHVAGITTISRTSSPLSSRRSVRSADAPFSTTRLILGAAGISLAHADEAVTVRYADCAALCSWPDGARHLIGTDGTAVHVEPSLWRLPKNAFGEIDAGVPTDRHVAMASRSPEEIPHPGTTAGMRFLGRVLKEPVVATLVTLAVAVGVAFGVGLVSATAGEIVGGIMALTLFTWIGLMRVLRARLWMAAAKRARGVEFPSGL